MAKVVTKKKVLKSTTEDKDIIEIFNNIMNNNVNLRIIHSKYKTLQTNCARFIKVMDLINHFCANQASFKEDVNAAEDFAGIRSAIEAYVGRYNVSFNIEFNAPYDAVAALVNKPEFALDPKAGFNSVPDELAKEFAEKYKFLRAKSYCIEMCLKTCNEMVKNYRPYLQAKQPLKPGAKEVTWLDIPDDKISGKFIDKHPDVTLAPICGLADLNFKYIYQAANSDFSKMIPLFMKKILGITLEIVNTINIPDVDPNDFSLIIISSLEKVRQALPDCKDAFDKIEESIGLLKDNFKTYYTSLIETSNPTNVMEEFITDISKQPGLDLKVVGQFKKIIMYYRKLTESQKNNPKFKKIFGKAESHIKIIDSMTESFGIDTTAADNLDDEQLRASAEEGPKITKSKKKRLQKMRQKQTAEAAEAEATVQAEEVAEAAEAEDTEQAEATVQAEAAVEDDAAAGSDEDEIEIPSFELLDSLLGENFQLEEPEFNVEYDEDFLIVEKHTEPDEPAASADK